MKITPIAQARRRRACEYQKPKTLRDIENNKINNFDKEITVFISEPMKTSIIKVDILA